MLGFFDVFYFRFSHVANHFQYLACIGLVCLVASTGRAIWERVGQRGRDLGTVAAAIALLILGVSTWRQARIYQDLKTLWGDTLMKNPQCWIAHSDLGVVSQAQGKVQGAIEHYEQALRIKPDYAEVHYNLGNALARVDRVPEAIVQYEQALRLRPDYAEAHLNLGAALVKLDKPNEAIRQYEQALRIRPNDPEALNNLAWLLAVQAPAEAADPVRAVALAERACQLAHNRVATYLDTLAAACAAAARFSNAIATAE